MFRCPLPSTGSAQGAFPCFAGSTRHSDSLTTFPPGFVAFASAVPPPPVVRSQKEAGAHLPQAWAFHRMPTGHLSWSRQGLPGSWATLLCACPALRPRRDPKAWPCFGSGVLPSATITASALATILRFRGSITRPTHLLSTLRSPGYPGTTQDSLPAGALLCRAGFEPAGLLSEVSASTSLPPRPGFSWRTMATRPVAAKRARPPLAQALT